MKSLRAILVAAVAAVFALAAFRAAAADNEPMAKSSCFDAHEQGQLSRNRGHLRAARASFLQCSNEICPALVRKDCLEWVEQVTIAQPTVTVAATDAQGRDRSDVRFFVDDELIADRITGAPIVLDPGEHRLRFETVRAAAIEQTVLLREGEKGRILTIQFATAPSAPPVAAARTPAVATSHRASSAPLTYALAGASLAAFGAFSYFAVTGKSLEHDRASSCSPRCSPDAVSPIKRDYAIADVALGVGLVTAGLAVWSMVSSDGVPSAQSVKWLDVRATNGGAKVVLLSDF